MVAVNFPTLLVTQMSFVFFYCKEITTTQRPLLWASINRILVCGTRAVPIPLFADYADTEHSLLLKQLILNYLLNSFSKIVHFWNIELLLQCTVWNLRTYVLLPMPAMIRMVGGCIRRLQNTQTRQLCPLKFTYGISKIGSKWQTSK